jgi:PAS domain S-box-containing protein
MHYTGMAAASFHTAHVIDATAAVSTSTPMAITIGFATLLVLGLALVSGLIDRRFAAQTAEFESLFLQNPSAIYTCTLDGTIRSVNPAAAALHQCSSDALIGQPLAKVVSHDHNQIQPYLDHAKLGVVQTWDCTLVQTDATRTAHLTALPIIVAGQIVGTYVIADDITARVNAEAAVRESEQRYRTMLRDLATPVIPITDAVVVLPIVGALDLDRTQQMETRLLHDLAERRAQVVIIDLTGVPVIDAAVAQALLRMLQAVRLLGVDAMITGLRAHVALTLVQLGTTLTGLQIQPTLQEGINAAIASANQSKAGIANNLLLLATSKN